MLLVDCFLTLDECDEFVEELECEHALILQIADAKINPETKEEKRRERRRKMSGMQSRRCAYHFSASQFIMLMRVLVCLPVVLDDVMEHVLIVDV